ncbi:MAG: transcriptional repressor [bacterium]|nr:transcriptional repressor [bacterium]
MDRANELLRGIGEKCTEQRKLILKALLELARPVSADELYMYLSGKGRIGRTTVYRTLELFEQKKLVKRIIFKDGIIRYESTHLGHHHHLICLSCGKVFSIKKCAISSLDGFIIEDTDFLVTEHFLEFYGFCEKCRGDRV